MHKFTICILIIFCSLFCMYGSASAKNMSGVFELHDSEKTFIDFTNFISVHNLYTQGFLKIELETSTNTKLVKNGNKLQFQTTGAQSGTGIIHVAYKNITRDISIIIDVPDEIHTVDYNIFSDMPYHRLQERSLSCESSATSDILSYLEGRNITENDILYYLPKSNYYNILPGNNENGKVWGDPHKGFVGYINSKNGVIAKQNLMTGYGVYEEPIAEVYNQYGYETEIINLNTHNSDFTAKQHLRKILGALSSGDMVQLWGDWCTVWKYDDGDISNLNITTEKAKDGSISARNECYNVLQDRTLYWQYKDNNGNMVDHEGLDGQHAFILLGWKGDIDRPTHIRVWDTNTGYHEYATNEWMRKWEAMDYRSIIIRK